VVRRTLLVLATLALSFAATPALAVKSAPKSVAPTKLAPETNLERPDAKTLLLEAKELWHLKGDYNGARAKFDAAVDVDPSDPEARLQRAHFYEVVSGLVAPDDKPKFQARAQLDFEYIAASDPDSLIAGIARDGLMRLAGEPLIEPKRVACPEPATLAHARADALYGARQYADAAVEYESATAGCPEAAAWWVDFADAYYVQAEYGRAKELFVKALSVDPWNREGHRFLADTELRLDNATAAIHQLVLAVVSDPVYEAGWSAFRTYATAMGWNWNRVYGDRNAEPGNPDAAPWVAYRAAKAGARDAAAGPFSALTIERDAVKAGLKVARSTQAGAAPGPFWSMMARADDAGFLDEAIFLHMLDAPLAAEYPAFRDANAERLASYLETVILR
jgi:tetratricopeptide (TPR) repeat protein